MYTPQRKTLNCHIFPLSLSVREYILIIASSFVYNHQSLESRRISTRDSVFFFLLLSRYNFSYEHNDSLQLAFFLLLSLLYNYIIRLPFPLIRGKKRHALCIFFSLRSAHICIKNYSTRETRAPDKKKKQLRSVFHGK